MRVLVAGALVLAITAAASAQPIDPGEGPVVLTAKTLVYDSRAGVVSAEGEVELSREGRRLLADRIVYDERADRVEAEGNVVLLEPTGEALFADRVALTGDLREGFIEELRGLMADDSRFAAARGSRQDGNTTVMQRVVYSPCEICPDAATPPLWQISARQVIHDQAAREVRYRDAFLELFGVPVAYTPYFAHPDPSVDRQSGFLVPTVRSDSELGFTLETPYHLVLAPNRDVTLAPIVTTNEGLVLAGEYRELRELGPMSLEGSITRGSTFQDAEGAGSDKAIRGHVDGRARYNLAGPLGPGWRGGVDLGLSSDRTYRRRYGFGHESILTNRVFAERIFERSYGVIGGYAFQGLRAGDRSGETPIVLPLAETSLIGPRGRLGERWTADASLVALTRTDGLDTRRVSLEAGVELPRRGLVGDLFELRASLRGDLYHTDGDPVTRSPEGDTNVVGRVLPRVTLDWRWPLVRDGEHWQHLVEPLASASVSPYGGNDRDIPNEDSLDFEFDDSTLFEPIRFTGLDRVEGGPKLAYGLRFTSHSATGQRIAGLVGQSFRPRADTTFGRGSGLEGRFSDYVGRIDYTPAPILDVGYRFRVRRDEARVLRNDLRVSVGPPRLRLDVAYLQLTDEPDEEEFERREEITATVRFGITRDLAISMRTRRDLTAHSTIANSFGLVYNNPCLLLVAGVEQSFTRTRDVRPTTTITVRASLRNLGDLRAGTSLIGRS